MGKKRSGGGGVIIVGEANNRVPVHPSISESCNHTHGKVFDKFEATRWASHCSITTTNGSFSSILLRFSSLYPLY